MRSTLALCFCILLLWDGTKALTPEEKQRNLDLEKQFIQDIMTDYNDGQRPPTQTEHTTVVVTVNAWIARARWHQNIAEMEMTLRQEWVDSRLLYNVGGLPLEYITLPLDKKVWKPDTFFATAEEMKKKNDMQFTRVEPEGYVMNSQRYTVKVQCKSASNYPLVDRKVCSLKMGSYGYTYDDIAYFWRQFDPISYNEQAGAFEQYSLTDFDSYECDTNATTGRYSCITVDLTFEGPVYEPIVYVLMPSILLLFLSWLHFWIDGSWTVPRSLSAVVPFVVFVLAMFFIPHPHNCSITAQEVWLLFCVLLAFLSALEYFLCILFGARRYGPGTDAEKPLLHSDKPADGSQAPQQRNRATLLDGLSRIIFPVLFVVFLILFLILYLV